MKWEMLPANRFESVAAQWDRLNTSGLPVLGSANVARVLRYFGSGKERIAVGSSGGEVVAMTMLRAGLAAQAFQPSNQPVGLWVQKPARPLAELVEGLAQANG